MEFTEINQWDKADQISCPSYPLVFFFSFFGNRFRLSVKDLRLRPVFSNNVSQYGRQVKCRE